MHSNWENGGIQGGVDGACASTMPARGREWAEGWEGCTDGGWREFVKFGDGRSGGTVVAAGAGCGQAIGREKCGSGGVWGCFMRRSSTRGLGRGVKGELGAARTR